MKLSSKEARAFGLAGGKRPKSKNSKTHANVELFKAACVSYGLPEPMPEFVFHPIRKWRFDWAFPCVSHFCQGVALEIEGGIWRAGGGHNSVSGMLRDIEKYNEAQICGWIVLRCTPDDIQSLAALELVRRVLEARKLWYGADQN